ncbi:MAG TPA: hypothetical protein DDY98_04330 [Ruminococcaceae bacterium]|nr:hypothetical protein [Oscillospiraceae bacterium]
MLSDNFICASHEYSTYTKAVPAPYFRKSFCLDSLPKSCRMTVCGLGFYELYINGRDITKGLCAPYISNPDHLVYYDSYNILPYLTNGKNTVGILLGNGMQNAPGGQIWDFDDAPFRGSPRVAFAIEWEDSDGTQHLLQADETVKTASSPYLFDDLRCGCVFDARMEQNGWNLPGFDDSAWQTAKIAERPRGEKKLCRASAIVRTETKRAVSVTKRSLAPYQPRHDVPPTPNPFMSPQREGWVFDFGENVSGVPILKVSGQKGQQLDLQFAERINEKGELDYSNMEFYPDGYAQRDIYILKGDDEEIFSPLFTYHGARYCCVIGLKDEQVKADLLTFAGCTSAPVSRGEFFCSDETANTLQHMTRNSDQANFFYFPTDCPHREKNGWTGDANASCEQMLLNFAVEDSCREWLTNIRAAQLTDGRIPAIVPTDKWGYRGCNGPAWDAALIELPYRIYLYRGEKAIVEENADAIFHYLNFLSSLRNEKGTISYGLGDWCPVTTVKAPVELTDTLISMDICRKAAFLFGEVGRGLQQKFALALYEELRAAARKHLIDFSTLTVVGTCQTSQAMALYYGAFDEEEKPKALERLLDFVRETQEHIDFGLLGQRVLFRVLAEFGYAQTAFHMIVRRDYPSYGHLIDLGLTSLPENFLTHGSEIHSLNHHFMGDISAFFFRHIAGIQVNPNQRDCREVAVKPNFVEPLRFAKAHCDTAVGRVAVKWERNGGKIVLVITAGEENTGKIVLPSGWVFEDTGSASRVLMSGTYQVVLK